LKSRRTVSLVSLRQDLIYEMIMMGFPTATENNLEIQALVAEAGKQFGAPVFIIPPARRSSWRSTKDSTQALDRALRQGVSRHRIPEYLPEVGSIGFFRSSPMGKDPDYDASTLTIAWFQDGYGVSPETVAAISEIDWEAHAQDSPYW
jgi:hypothetical protein